MRERTYLSWSEVSAWLHCQQAWHWKYKEGLRVQGTVPIRLQMGSAVHRILQTYYSTHPLSRSFDALERVVEDSYKELDLTNDDHADLRRPQLEGYASIIWATWEASKDFPTMTTEMPIKVPVPWDNNKGFLCVPDAFHFSGGNGVLMSHKTSLSVLPDVHRLVMFHQQARMEAWALREAFNLKELEIYFNVMTPKKAEREGPLLYGEFEHAHTGQELEAMFAQVGKVPIVTRTGGHCYQCDFFRLHSDISTGIDFELAKSPFTSTSPTNLRV